jgi:hypothetical protein
LNEQLAAMGTVSKVVVVLPIIAIFGQLLYPKLEFAGVFRTALEVNNGNCKSIPGIEYCEDAW